MEHSPAGVDSKHLKSFKWKIIIIDGILCLIQLLVWTIIVLADSSILEDIYYITFPAIAIAVVLYLIVIFKQNLGTIELIALSMIDCCLIIISTMQLMALVNLPVFLITIAIDSTAFAVLTWLGLTCLCDMSYFYTFIAVPMGVVFVIAVLITTIDELFIKSPNIYYWEIILGTFVYLYIGTLISTYVQMEKYNGKGVYDTQQSLRVALNFFILITSLFTLTAFLAKLFSFGVFVV